MDKVITQQIWCKKQSLVDYSGPYINPLQTCVFDQCVSNAAQTPPSPFSRPRRRRCLSSLLLTIHYIIALFLMQNIMNHLDTRPRILINLSLFIARTIYWHEKNIGNFLASANRQYKKSKALCNPFTKYLLTFNNVIHSFYYMKIKFVLFSFLVVSRRRPGINVSK